MAELIYATELTRHGPWLIDSTALEKLDAIIEQELKRMVEATEEKRLSDAQDSWGISESGRETPDEVVKLVRAEADKLRSLQTSRRILIHFENGDKFEATSFVEAKRHPSIDKQRVK